MINSLGNDKGSSYNAIMNGECGIDIITHYDPTGHSVQIAGEVKNFDPKEVMNPKEVKKADRFIQLGMKAAIEAMEDSNLRESKFEEERFGIVSASGIGGLTNIEKNSLVSSNKGQKRISPFFIPSSLVNMLGGFITIEFGLKGPNLSDVTACAAGSHAIATATKTIMLNGADKMLVVGAETAICEVGIGGFASMKALSTRNDNPKKASRPFDADRNGFVMGEGAAALVLEELDSAKARGAKIYGEVIGFGESGDANHITTPVVDGPLRAMKAALDMAKTPKIDYINAHGTSTPANDKNETLAIKDLFGVDSTPLVSSIKGQIGHCLGAAGAIEAVVCLMAMKDNRVPPTINYETPDPDCDLDYITDGSREMQLDTVMSNSFGFGGTNCCLILKKV
jgi:3-oxoacyl-[acyl-carrier-protein] synthase II